MLTKRLSGSCQHYLAMFCCKVGLYRAIRYMTLKCATACRPVVILPRSEKVRATEIELSYSGIAKVRHCRSIIYSIRRRPFGGSVAEWLACWTQAQKAWVQIAVATLSYANCSYPLCLRSPSSKIGSYGSSPLKGCGGNYRPGGK